jgi:hypothetical protein
LNAGKKPNGSDLRAAQELVNDFVRAMLRDGEQEVAALERAAQDAGLLRQDRPVGQDRRFRKARDLLGVEAYQRHRRWHWRLPAGVISDGVISDGGPVTVSDDVPVTSDVAPNPSGGAVPFGGMLARALGATADDPPAASDDAPEASIASDDLAKKGPEALTAPSDDPPSMPAAAVPAQAPASDAQATSADVPPPHADRQMPPKAQAPRSSDAAVFYGDPERAAALARVAEWRAGFAKLDRQRPPPLVSHHRWCAFLDDAERFLNSRWALIAASLGTWTSEALFGFNPHRGLIAVAQLGLLWHVEGGKILELSGGDALVERARTPRPYTRRPFHPAVRLPWALDQRPRRTVPAHDARQVRA